MNQTSTPPGRAPRRLVVSDEPGTQIGYQVPASLRSRAGYPPRLVPPPGDELPPDDHLRQQLAYQQQQGGQYSQQPGQYPQQPGPYQQHPAYPQQQYPQQPGGQYPQQHAYPQQPGGQYPQQPGPYPQQSPYPQQQGYPPQQAYPQLQAHPGMGYAPYHTGPMSGLRPVKRIATGLYVLVFLFGLVGGGALTAWALTDGNVEELLAFSWVPLLLSAIFFWILLYRAWAAIQDGHTSVSPGKALGLLFIPLFNIYWVFIAIGTWAKEFNFFADRHGLVGFRAGSGLFIAHCVLMLIPFGAAVTPITGTLVVVHMCRGINAIADRRMGGLPMASVVAAPAGWGR